MSGVQRFAFAVLFGMLLAKVDRLARKIVFVQKRPPRTAFLGWKNTLFWVWEQGWAGKAFWLPGTGREIENHIPVLREGNGNSQIATGREGKGNLRLVIPGIPGNPGNHIKSKVKLKIIFMPWQAIRSQSRYIFNQCKYDICNTFTRSVLPPVYQTIGLPLFSTMSKKHEFLPELIHW